jgi:hypothetical protein
MIVGEELFADVPLVLRMALHWDIAYITGHSLPSACTTRHRPGGWRKKA